MVLDFVYLFFGCGKEDDCLGVVKYIYFIYFFVIFLVLVVVLLFSCFLYVKGGIFKV